MSQDSSSIPSTSRFTLKLKPSSRKAPREASSLPRPAANSARPQGKLSQKPGAAWSDELKHRMQKDMDALLTR
jgi:hypothetical protein